LELPCQLLQYSLSGSRAERSIHLRASAFQCIELGQILLPGDCSLVSNQGVFADDESRNAIKLCGSPCPEKASAELEL
jgi:hypothetical protein